VSGAAQGSVVDTFQIVTSMLDPTMQKNPVSAARNFGVFVDGELSTGLLFERIESTLSNGSELCSFGQN